MSQEFGLYETETKQYIWLGKPLANHNSTDYARFQIKSELIAEFLARHCDYGHFEVHAAGGNMPHEQEAGWIKLADWNSKTLKEIE